MTTSHVTIDSPIGRLTLIASDDGLCGIRFPNDPVRPATDGPIDPWSRNGLV